MITGTLPSVSNRETITLEFELIDDETDELIDFGDVTEITIEAVPRNDGRGSDYGYQSPGRRSLSATLTDGGITEIETGVIQVIFSVDDAEDLCAGIYDIGGTMVKDGETIQFLLGSLPVLNGVVSR